MTNTSAAALAAALGVPTNGGVFTGSGALLTNLSVNSITGNFSGTYTMPVVGWAPTNSPTEEFGNNVVGNTGSFLGGGDVQLMTNTFHLTNIVIAIAGNGSNVTAEVKEWMISNPTNMSFSWFSTAISTQTVTFPGSVGGTLSSLTSFTVSNAPLVTNGSWLVVAAIPTNMVANSLLNATWYYDTGNTNNPRERWVNIQSTTTNVVNASPAYNGNSCTAYRLYGYATVPVTNLADYIGSLAGAITATSITNASLLPFGNGASGLPAENVQAAVDAVAAPFAASNTVFAAFGDSLTAQTTIGNHWADILRYGDYRWWSSLAYFTNYAVGGASLYGAGNTNTVTNQWATGSSIYSGSGMNKICGLWVGANDLAVNPYEWLTVYSNLVHAMVVSNWHPILFTVMPRASYGYDVAPSWFFAQIVNNWIRNTPLAWRVVDTERLFPNCYDMSVSSDTTHKSPVGQTNIAAQVNAAVLSPQSRPAQSWSGHYGTNWVVAVPGTNNTPGALVLSGNGGGLQFPANPVAAWPTAAATPGGCALVNSNSFPYLLRSSPGGTAWVSTNPIGWTP